MQFAGIRYSDLGGGDPGRTVEIRTFQQKGEMCQFTKFKGMSRPMCQKGCPNLRILSIPLGLILTHSAWIGTAFWQRSAELMNCASFGTLKQSNDKSSVKLASHQQLQDLYKPA